jgi:dephospho-CoA kinase
VARLFTVLGATLIDTDQISRGRHCAGTALQASSSASARRAGPGWHPGPPRLRQIAFADAQARADLEAITHPAILARLPEAADPRRSVPAHRRSAAAETGTRHDYDRVLVVDCEPQLQLRRLMVRDGLTAADAQRMIDAQATREARLAIADDVIRNDGDVDQLAAQVEALHARYLAQAGVSAGR